MQSTSRDYSLDLIRAIAVTLVIFHHFFQEINYSHYPFFVQQFIQFFISHGAYGVQLFFAVSGYIMISKYATIMSLFKYMVLRYTRLVPMLSVIVLFNLVLFKVSQTHDVDILSILPSILIIEPEIFNSVFNTTTYKWIDDSFWTLFVEIRFYLLFGFMMKILGSRTLMVKKISLSVLCLFSQITYAASGALNLDLIHKLCFWILIPDHFIYFLVGVMLYSPKTINIKSLLLFLLPIEFVYIIMQLLKSPFTNINLLSNQSITLILYFSFIFFAFYISKKLIMKFTTLKIVAKAIGFPSYTSYLLHQNFFLIIFPYFSKTFDHVILCFLVYFLVIIISIFLSKNIEPRLIKLFRSKFQFK
jgi:peptidoglycan/LPS O-acetylase OafA/YrhL